MSAWSSRPDDWRTYPYWRNKRREAVLSTAREVLFFGLWVVFLIACAREAWAAAASSIGGAWFLMNAPRGNR